MQVLHRDDLHRGAFAGLREHRLVMDPMAFGNQPEWGAMRVYGGRHDQNDTDAAKTLLDVASLQAGGRAAVAGPFMANLVTGKGADRGHGHKRRCFNTRAKPRVQGRFRCIVDPDPPVSLMTRHYL